MLTRNERVLWGACAGLAGWIAVHAWRTWGPTSMAQPPETAHADALAVARTPAPAWIDAHFAAELAPMGDPPPEWTAIEADLTSPACGACHVAEFLDWRESWHAGATGPGVTGQYMAMDAAEVAKCQRCHAPLAESPELGCAACHVRGWTRYGPPKDAPMADAPHDGFVGRQEFGDSRFCESCHDFETDRSSMFGKRVQETWAEWSATDYAKTGVTCQSCHMPEGRHLWKGIHDADMVRSAMDVAWGAGSLRVTNVGAGHRLPTYVTPEILLVVEQFDATGAPLPGTRQTRVIARRLTLDAKTEIFDTRLMPGESLALDYRPAAGAREARGRVECWPDEAYRRFYESKLADEDWNPEGRAEIEEALRRSIASRFVVWEGTAPI